ncbi:hypothetical protein QZH41_018173, partial [Actinostola sp. cb2023]
VTWSAVVLFVAIWYQSTSSIKAAALQNGAVKYGVVMDAGSSGTRVKVYKYIQGQHSPITPSDVQQVQVPPPDQLKPGISAFGDSIDKIKTYLAGLIDNAKKVVPADQQSVTPIMLFATGGMRLLPKYKQDAVFDEVDLLFRDKSFCPFLYSEANVRIITGEEEAVFGWITLNFIKGTFSSSNSINSFGALDLGGASTQNTFRVSDKGTGQPTITVKLAGKTYPLYAHSYLGYGANEATDSYLKSLAGHQPIGGTRVLTSPCHNSHYTHEVEIDNDQYVLKGNYNEAECQASLKNKFFCNGSEDKCPMTNQPVLEGRFFGTVVFYYAMKDIGVITNHGEIASLSKFELFTRRFCKQPSESLSTKLYDVYNLCFRLNYVYELLKDGYHVDMNTFVLHIANKVDDYDLNWTLGALLYKSKIL